jgi:hypothetical protein
MQQRWTQPCKPCSDLNQLLNQIYREASYAQRLNYLQPPTPPLTEVEKEWANEILSTAHLI